MSCHKYSVFVVLLFLIFVVLSIIPLPGNAYGGAGSIETGYIEAFQAIILVSILIVAFLRKKYLINAYSRFAYWLRQSLFSLLLYEEISYLTTDRFDFAVYNNQSELNFHNSKLLGQSVASFNFIGDDTVHLYPLFILATLIAIFLYVGSSIPAFRKFHIISLHPSVRIAIICYLLADGLLKLASLYLIRNLFSLDNYLLVNPAIINLELLELFMYIVFLADIVIKSFPRLVSNTCR